MRGENRLDIIAKGIYEQSSETNYEEFLKAINVNYFTRKAASASRSPYGDVSLSSFFTPKMEVKKEPGMWSFRTYNMFTSMKVKFEIVNEVFPPVYSKKEADGIVHLDDQKFICVQRAKKDGDKVIRSIYEFSSYGCNVTKEVVGEDVVCVQIFKRL